MLLILGALLYTLVARQLANEAEERLFARAATLEAATGASGEFEGQTGPFDGPHLGYEFGGPSAGTIAFLLDASRAPRSGPPVTLRAPEPVLPVPLDFSLSGELGGSMPPGVLWIGSLDGTPARVTTVKVASPTGDLAVGIVADRTAELETLDRLRLLLLVAIPFVTLAAGLAGWVYSGRALVPIERSLERQRQFASDASHELRTPLTVLGSSLETVRREPPPSDGAAEALDDALEVTERMGILLDDLLLLARADTDAPPLDRSALDLADEAADALAGLAEKAQACSVSVELDASPTPTHGDPHRLRRLVTILVDNAIVHGREGGKVWVRVRTDGDDAVLTVDDDGPGIPSEQRRRVFGRFWRGPGAGEGHGLGLAIAHGIVVAHEGRIEASRSPAGGARFEVVLGS